MAAEADVDGVSYREHAVAPWLRGLAECGWTVDAPPVATERDVLPDGCMDLVWADGRLLVAGPDTGPHPHRQEAALPAAGLRFAPGALPALLGVPAAAVRDARVPLAEFHPGLATRAHARLDHGGDAMAVLTCVARSLPGSGPAAALRVITRRLAAGGSAAATAEALGWTTRSLHRRCLTAFGYGPAVLRRVLRFRRAAALLHAGVPIAQTAARAGYADQPHLSREVRALAGVTPDQLASGAKRSTPLPSGSCTTA